MRDDRRGSEREPRGSESAPSAMVIIWTVTDTNSFPPEAGQGQTVSPWGGGGRERERDERRETRDERRETRERAQRAERKEREQVL
jgi:hypothetical protein